MRTTIALLVSIMFFFSCGEMNNSSSGAFSINGDVEGAGNLKVYLDKYNPINKSSEILTQEEINQNGEFKIAMEENPDPGIYRLRIGAQETLLILEGEEDNISVSGNLDGFNKNEVKIEGSPLTSSYLGTINSLRDSRGDVDDIVSKITNTESALSSAVLSFRVLRGQDRFLGTYKSIHQRLKSENPSHAITTDYGKFVAQVEQMKIRREANQKIKVGQMAPDIVMEDPEGNSLSLSDTKGKVVLLDFWASWCKPCRIANPHVVEMYHKYKDDGFTVFSVSLDGVDSRLKKRLQTEERVNRQLESSKKRWKQAIEQDNLEWKWHVSDLKKWDSDASALYGVSSIPRTFLLDREGKIIAVNLRNNNLESELKKVL